MLLTHYSSSVRKNKVPVTSMDGRIKSGKHWHPGRGTLCAEKRFGARREKKPIHAESHSEQREFFAAITADLKAIGGNKYNLYSIPSRWGSFGVIYRIFHSVLVFMCRHTPNGRSVVIYIILCDCRSVIFEILYSIFLPLRKSKNPSNVNLFVKHYCEKQLILTCLVSIII